MKNINSIKLTNFQSHKDTTIEFAGLGCLTVITGPSDSGKSAVIRALRWLFYNMPLGTDFITVGEDKCSVKVIFEDGTTIERIRSHGGINRYLIDGQIFEGFGTGVPIETQQATGIRKLQIGDQNFLLNMSEQLDGPFLGKSVPGSARAKVLGKLAGTEEIDLAGKEIGTDLYRARRQQEALGRESSTIHELIQEYSWIEESQNSLCVLKSILEETQKSQGRILALKGLKEQLEIHSATVSKLRNKLNMLSRVDQGLDVIKWGQDNLSAKNLLSGISRIARKAAEQIEDSRSKIAALRRIEDAEVISGQIDLISGKLGVLSNLSIKHLKSKDDRENSLRNYMSLGIIYREAIPLLEASVKSQELASPLADLYQEYCKARTATKDYQQAINRAKGVAAVDSVVLKAHECFENLFGVRDLQEKYVLLIRKILEQKNHLSITCQVSDALEKDYFELMSSLGICPTCGGDINIEKLREVF